MRADLLARKALQSKLLKNFWKEVRIMSSSSDGVDFAEGEINEVSKAVT